MKCIEDEHDYDFIGFMVVAEGLERNKSNLPLLSSKNQPGTMSRVYEVPKHFAAKIEVHQCKKCGDITLKPAVFTRL